MLVMVRDMSDQCRIAEMIINHVSSCSACISSQHNYRPFSIYFLLFVQHWQPSLYNNGTTF